MKLVLSFFMLTLMISCVHKQTPAEALWNTSLNCDPQEPTCEEF